MSDASFVRTAYVAPAARPRLTLEDGGRLIVHAIVNIEEWSIAERMPRTALPPPAGDNVVPDVANWAWHEYGMRCGIWRIMEVLAKHGVRATTSLNANVCNSYPAIVEGAAAAGWEMMGHGFVQKAMHAVADRRDTIARTIATIEGKTGKRIRGWLGPGLVETWDTLDLLAEAGIAYCCDWGPADDQPYELNVRSGRMLAVPYPVDMNDIVISAIALHRSDELFERGKAQFETLYAESEQTVKVLPIALHAYLTGAPHRIGYLDKLLAYLRAHEGVRFMTGGEIHDWYRAQTSAATR